MQKNVTLLVGPSGGGKTTFLQLLETLNINLKEIISLANRTIRNGEINGKSYNFTNETVESVLSRNDDFIQLLTFLEDEKMKHLFYGIEKKSLDKQLKEESQLIYAVIDAPMALSLAEYISKNYENVNIDVVYIAPSKDIIIDFLIKRLDFDEKIKGLELKECLINAGDIQKLSYFNTLDTSLQATLLELPYRLRTIEEKLNMMENLEKDFSDITQNKIIKLQTPDSYFQEYSKQKELNLVDNRKIATPLKEMVGELLGITLDDIERDKDKNDGQGKIRTLLINIGNVIRNPELKNLFIENEFKDLGFDNKEKIINALFENMNIKNFYYQDFPTLRNEMVKIVENFFNELKKEHSIEELKSSDLLVMYYIDKAKKSNAKIICTDCRMPQELEEFSKSAPVYLVLREFRDDNGNAYAKFYDKDDNQLKLNELLEMFNDCKTYQELVEALNKNFNVDRTEALGMILSIDAFNQINKESINPELEKELSVLRAKTFPLFIPNATNQEKYVEDNRAMIENVLSSSQIVLMGVAKAGKDHTLKMLEKALYKFKNEQKEMVEGNIISIRPIENVNAPKFFYIVYEDQNKQRHALSQPLTNGFVKNPQLHLEGKDIKARPNNIEFINSMIELWETSVQARVEISSKDIKIVDFIDDGESRKKAIIEKINLAIPLTQGQETHLREHLKTMMMAYTFENINDEFMNNITQYLNIQNIKYEQPYFSAYLVNNKDNKGFEVEITHPNGLEYKTETYETLKEAEQRVNKINKSFCETWEGLEKLTKSNQGKIQDLKINEEIPTI